MARPTVREISRSEFLDEGGDDEAQADPNVTVEDGDAAGVAGNDELPPEPAKAASESEAGDAPPAPEAPPVDAPPPDPAAAQAAEPEVQHDDPTKPNFKPPPWNKFKQYERDSQEYAERKAQWEKDQQELALLRAQQQLAQQQAEAMRQQQYAAQQGPWTPQSGRMPTAQEFEAYRQEDPFGAQQFQSAVLAQQQEQIQQQLQQMERGRELERQTEAFRRQHPDYDDALNYAAERVRAEARLMGFASPEQQEQYLQYRASVVVHAAQTNGISLPDALYTAAQQLYGWAAPAAEATAAPAAPAPTQTPQQRVQQSIARTQATATTVPPTGRGLTQQAGKLTREEYLALSPEEEDEMEAKYGEKWFEKMVELG